MHDSASLPFHKAYGGDPIEMNFRPWSCIHLPFYWHFREVLRQSPTRSDNWLSRNGDVLGDPEQLVLVRISLYSYHCFTSFVDAMETLRELRAYVDGGKVYDILYIKRTFSNGFTSIYRAVSAICNVVDELCNMPGPTQKSRPKSKILQELEKHSSFDSRECARLLRKADEKLAPRTHLDHYHLAWILADPKARVFLVDREIVTKGIIRLEQPGLDQFENGFDILFRYITDASAICNQVYQILAKKDGLLDVFLSSKSWRVNYKDYGEPWNGQRPIP